MAGTTLQMVYDAFFIKSGVDYTDQEDKVYQYFKTGVGKTSDTTSTDLTYTVSADYSGNFTATLTQKDIELIALYMFLEEKRRKKSTLDNIKKDYIGTKDFNRLPNKLDEYKMLNQSMKDLQDEIFLFRQEFYSYENT
jgi:hypothetical protein